MLIDNTSIPPTGIAHQGISPEQTEAIAILRIFDGDPVALACHRLGLESRAEPRPRRLHVDDIDLIVQQVAAALALGEQAAHTVRAARKGALRYTGTALGDRAATGRDNDPYPIYTHEELTSIETNKGADA